MKLPRWLVISMLTSSVLSVLAAAGWWWVTWPERTGSEFAKLLTARRTEEAVKMVRADSPEVSALFVEAETENSTFTDLECGPRSLLDAVMGRQEFQLVGTRTVHATCGSRDVYQIGTAIRFIAERGSVLLDDEEVQRSLAAP